MNGDIPAMSCGGFNPYDSATTNAKWFFALAARESERRNQLKILLNAVLQNPKGFAHVVYDALGRALRGRD